MDEGNILVYCCPSTVPSLWPPPPSPINVQYSIYRQCLGWGVLKWTVDHILQEFYTLFLTRFRTYKIVSTPQTKMTSKDDIKGLASLFGLFKEIVHRVRRGFRVRRRAAVRRPRDRISARYPSGWPLPERTAMRILERNSTNVLNECVVYECKLIKCGSVPPNL